jgi:hypothetical protein
MKKLARKGGEPEHPQTRHIANSLDFRLTCSDDGVMPRSGGLARWWFRAARLAVLSLLLGFVTTWLAAWGLLLWMPRDADLEYFDYGARSKIRITGGGWRRSSWTFAGGMAFVPHNQALPHEMSGTYGDPVPAWSMTHAAWERHDPLPRPIREVFDAHLPDQDEARPVESHYLSWVEQACGWPFRCFRAWATKSDEWRSCASCPTWLRDSSTRWPHGLPYLPWWPGLIGNTLIFATPWFLLFIGVGSARHHWRLRHGRCPWCKYDLRGDLDAGCPECGWGRNW